MRKNYGATNKTKTIVRDYPDVVRRVLIISGFVTIRYDGIKLIQINENKLDYIKKILSVEFSLDSTEKEDAKRYFNKLDSTNDEYLAIVEKYREVDRIDGEEYANKVFNIINTYKINEKIICQSINLIDSKKEIIEEFQEIPKPLKLEFYITILVALKYGKEFAIRPNYKADHIGKPYSHAPGNIGDIEIYSLKLYWLIEVTLIRNKSQQLNNETTSVIRHLSSGEEFIDHAKKYLSFIAPVIHEDTKKFYDFSVVESKTEKNEINIKPYNIEDFVDITLKKENFVDMEQYTSNVFEKFRSKLN